LATPVTVTIQKSGDCSNLVLRYTPDATPRTLVFGASLAVTIPGGTGTEAWAYGDHDLQLVLDPAQPSESVLVTTTLTVKKN
jgi:hypothetical protein